MTDTSTSTGSRPPTNIIAGNTFNPFAGATGDKPNEFPIGTPVCPSDVADNTVLPAQASDATSASVAGIAVTPGVVGDPVKVQTHGVLTLTTAQWDRITGDTGGLVHGLTYFLSPGPSNGNLTGTEPTTPGDFSVQVGIGLSPTDMMIQISPAALIA